MNNSAISEFFDSLAPTWDEQLITDDEIIEEILDLAGVCAGADVLDVACGTGVLMPYYLNRRVRSVTGIDISPKMAQIAQSKFDEAQTIRIVCGDIYFEDFSHGFDSIVVYNAFPHFFEQDRLIGRLASMLNPGGTLSVAHGMSRESIDSCHDGSASEVSVCLPEVLELSNIFSKYLDVTAAISDNRMYQVSGRKTED